MASFSERLALLAADLWWINMCVSLLQTGRSALKLTNAVFTDAYPPRHWTLLGSWHLWLCCRIQIAYSPTRPPPRWGLGRGSRPLFGKARSTSSPLAWEINSPPASFSTAIDVFEEAWRASQLFIAVMMFLFKLGLQTRTGEQRSA